MAVGGALLVLTLVDVVLTVMSSVKTVKPVSGRVLALLWRGCVAVLSGRHGALAVAGPVLTLVLVAGWVASLWGAWGLIFAGSPEAAIVSSPARVPASVTERVYFVGYTLATLGTGSFVAQGLVWRMGEVLVALTGFAVATLSLTFLMSVVSGVASKRSLAADLATLGGSPRGILARVWDGQGWQRLESVLEETTSSIHDVAQLHVAYPVLHHFHSPQRQTALPPTLAALDEALTTLIVARGAGSLDDLVLHRFRAATEELLSTLKSTTTFVSPSERVPAPPDVGVVADLAAGIDSEELRAERLSELDNRRAALLAYVDGDGWSWEDDVAGGPQRSGFGD